MDVRAEGDALMQLSRDWSARAATAPVDDWIDFWADDAVVMPPGLAPVRGKAAIRQYVEAAAKIPGFQIRWEPESAFYVAVAVMWFIPDRRFTRA
jgi:ketosteroid isomerase-like protein